MVDTLPLPELGGPEHSLALADLNLCGCADVAIMSRSSEFLSPAFPVFSWTSFNATVAASHHIIVGNNSHRAVKVMGCNCPVVLGS